MSTCICPHQVEMNTWNILRLREQGCPLQRVVLAKHFYDKDLEDIVTKGVNAELMWWNAVLLPERSLLLKDRSIRIRACQTEINVQCRKSNRDNPKRKRDATEIAMLYVEIEID